MIDCKDDYKYLGPYISYFEIDFHVRKGIIWIAYNKLHKILIWK